MIIMFLFVACSRENKQNSPPTSGPKKEQGANPPVGVVKVHEEKLALSSELFGKVLSTSVAEIRPQVNGIILERSFSEGSFVKKGTKLFQIDPAPYQAALDKAKGALKEAEATIFSAQKLVSRYKRLIKTRAISKQEYDNAVAALQQAQAGVAVAEAEVKQAEINLAYTNVYSPISGYVGKSLVTQGALVTANQATVLTVVRALDPVYVDLSFPTSEALALRKRLGEYQINEELTVTLVLDQVNDVYEHKGKVISRELAVDEASGSISIRALIPNPDLLLLPGMFVSAYVDQLGLGKQVLVPQMAVERDKNGDPNVWIIKEDGTVERRRIETGVMYHQDWTVERGISPGEMVAVDNLSILKSGMKVSPIPAGRQAEEKRVK